MSRVEQGIVADRQIIPETQNGQNSPLLDQLARTIETVDSIVKNLQDAQDGNPEDNLLASQIATSLKGVLF